MQLKTVNIKNIKTVIKKRHLKIYKYRIKGTD